MALYAISASLSQVLVYYELMHYLIFLYFGFVPARFGFLNKIGNGKIMKHWNNFPVRVLK